MDPELFGYLASITVAASLMLRNLTWLRGLNALGALMFVAYGLMIHAKPVFVLNGFIAAADIYYLVGILSARRPKDGATSIMLSSLLHTAGSRGGVALEQGAGEHRHSPPTSVVVLAG